jgi:hypothetical protein
MESAQVSHVPDADLPNARRQQADRALTYGLYGGQLGEGNTGGSMARQSRISSMRTASALLLLAVAGLIAAGVVKLGNDYFLSGAELIGWAIVPLALVLGFTWPVRCRVKTTRRKACGNWAYGFLFGCSQTAGHWTGKFVVRLGLKRQGESKPVGSRRLSANTLALNQPAPPSRPIRVTVEDGALAKCGFWVGFVSGIVSVVQAIISLMH